MWCPGCDRERIPLPIQMLEGVPLLAAGRLSGPWQRAIHTYKYRGRQELSEALVDPLAIVIEQTAPDLSSLAWVPLHPTRLGERGFNQSERLARNLGRRLRLPLLKGLERLRATPPQVGLPELERRSNVAGAFTWVNERPAPDGIGLVDDVCTTGATLSAAGAAIEAAGGRVSAYLVLAVAGPQTLPRPGVTFPGQSPVHLSVP